MRKHLFCVCWFLLAALFVFGCESVFGNDEEQRAGEIIKKHLTSPSSYQFREGKVLWRGTNDFGNSIVIKIHYEAQNAFGAKVAECMVVGYSSRKKETQWNPSYAISHCGSFRETPEMIKFFAGMNGLGDGSPVGVNTVPKKAPSSDFDTAFIKNFRTSFIDSCGGKDPGQDHIDLCTCLADKTISTLSVKQLQDQEFTLAYIKETIVPQCQ
jgi:hypothetical protein